MLKLTVSTVPLAWILIAVIFFQSFPESQGQYFVYVINVCHRKFGHRCIGAYISSEWILIPYECGWPETQQEYILLIADNPELDCIHGQYREPQCLYLPDRQQLFRNYRFALIRIKEPFIMDSSVGTIGVSTSDEPKGSCVMHFYSYIPGYSDFTLKLVKVNIVNMSSCGMFFAENSDEYQGSMFCGKAAKTISMAETVDLSGMSPFVCNQELWGFVVTANRSYVTIMSVTPQKSWIKQKRLDYQLNFGTNRVPSTGNSKFIYLMFCLMVLYII